ncbi:large ribosomal subunit protein mL44-like [Ptychodera flava]|uniref:large ribosomal subunit protein mL44-like n=1 Tax=Ptychodera flava TaxID=63121 RepID=UPI00396A8A59
MQCVTLAEKYTWYLEKMRRKHERKFGPPPPVPRSEHIELPWDYNSELYGFGKRLGEDFNEHTLRVAFTHKEFVQQEAEKRRELGMESSQTELNLQDNEELAEIGQDFASEYIKSYLRLVYPNFPDEGVKSVSDHLTGVELTSHIGSNLGAEDLIQYPIYPYPREVVQKTLHAVVGALLEQGADRAGLFVRDMFLPQLIGKDINDLWKIEDPMTILVNILEQRGQGLPEARMIRQTGSSTLVGMYMVGIYSDKKLLGFAPGESVLEAEDQATRVALKNIFGTNPESSPPIPVDGNAGKQMHHSAIEHLRQQNKLPQLQSGQQVNRTALAK